ncbi:MAG TPA: penicillin acylase family protein [Kofleriaceae bacterium]|nr:penicillin acylase family protein [Kofleriaceae bacterium]
MRRSLVIIFLFGCSGSTLGPGAGGEHTARPPLADEYRASIRWTEQDVPHILADDLGSLAFGQGYAFADKQGCLLAERIVVIHAQRARWFGAGDGDMNIDSDFAYLSLGVLGRAEKALPALSADARAVAAGYAAGYNARLAAGGFTGFCKGAAWVVPITAVDVLAHGLDASLMASSRAFAGAIGNAHPHNGGAPGSARADLPVLKGSVGASNGWAIGAERSASGHGLLVANPHFPWYGPLTFYESHLTVPGKLDAYGATLMGVPLLNIGFTADVAWTHTFSDAVRFTIYRITLDDKDPHKYRYGGETRAMTSRGFTIQVARAGGKLDQVSRTMWSSHYGPMLDGAPLTWDAGSHQAFTLRDAAGEANRGLDQYLGMMRAHSVAELRDAVARDQTTPFVNIIASDKAGDVFYADGSRVPNLSSQAIAAWRFARSTMPPVQQAWESGIVALDGSMPLFEWVDAPGAPAPGVIPFTAAPQMMRKDFVFNANDSCWIANPAQPLTAQSPLYGDIESTLSPRSRMNLEILTETGPGSASGDDGKFDADELERAILSNRVFTADLMLDEVLAACRAGRQPIPGCDVLARWDRHVDLDSAGALLWRELVGTFDRSEYLKGSMFATRFDPRRPLETPAVLADKPKILGRLATAVARLENAGIDLAAAPRAAQFTELGGHHIPVHGGPELIGTTNQAQYQPQPTADPGFDPGRTINQRTGLTDRGYPVNYGSSFVLVLAFADDGPHARGLMTYGSPEQMEAWSRKQLRPLRFTEADIRADPALRVQQVHAPR